jgi:hypothetical protein
VALLGKGAMIFWHDVAAGSDVDYQAWHSKEHLIERVGVPGFRRGCRYVATLAEPKYLITYEVDDLATLTSKPYVERLDDPTPWTQRALGHFRNSNRTLCRVSASFGRGIAAFALTLQLSPAPGRGESLRGWLSDAALPAMIERAGIVGAHLLEGDAPASRTDTAEKRLRDRPDAIADWVILIAAYDSAALEALRRGELATQVLVAHGAATAPKAGTYRLLHAITEPDLRA